MYLSRNISKTTWSTKRFVKGECTLIYDCFILPCCFFPTSFAFQRMYHVCPKFPGKIYLYQYEKDFFILLSSYANKIHSSCF